MRNKNNTETNGRKTEIAADIELAIMIFVLIAVAFAAGYSRGIGANRVLAGSTINNNISFRGCFFNE